MAQVMVKTDSVRGVRGEVPKFFMLVPLVSIVFRKITSVAALMRQSKAEGKRNLACRLTRPRNFRCSFRYLIELTH